MSSRRFATNQVVIKRAGATVHTGVPATDLFVADASELQSRFPTDIPTKMHTIFLFSDEEVREGDYLQFSGLDYPIRFVENWNWSGPTGFKRLFVEEIK